MEYKKIFWWTITLLIVTIVALGIFVWAVDIYGVREKTLLSAIPERTYNAITARNLDYDAAIFGSSVSENFKCSELDRAFGVHSMKFTLQGGSVTERAYIWDYVCRQRSIKLIISDIADLTFASRVNNFKIDQTFYEADRFPLREYLSSENFKSAISKVFFGVRGKTNRDELYSWYRNYEFGKKRLAMLYYNVDTATPKPNNLRIEDLRANLENHLLPVIRRHLRSDCRVVMFFPPYSILHFNKESIDRRLEFKRVIMEELLKVDGLILLDFQAASEIVCDLGLYRDDIHYNEKVNSWIISELDSPRFRVTPDRIGDFLDQQRQLVKSYDYVATYDELRKIIKK